MVHVFHAHNYAHKKLLHFNICIAMYQICGQANMFDLARCLKLRTKRCRSAPLVFSFPSCFFSSSILFNASHDKSEDTRPGFVVPSRIFLRSLKLGILNKAPIQNQTPKVVYKVPQFKLPKRKAESELKPDSVAWSLEQSRESCTQALFERAHYQK